MQRIISFILISVLLAARLLADIAVVNSPDGYIDVRKNSGIKKKSIGRLKNGDLVSYAGTSVNGWLEIQSRKVNSWDEQIVGLARENQLKLYSRMSVPEQKNLILEKLKHQSMLAEDFESTYKETFKNNTQSIYDKHSKAQDDLSAHTTEIYWIILEAVEEFYCKHEDSEVILTFMETIWAGRSSAFESPSFVMGYCYLCESGKILKILNSNTSFEWREVVGKSIDWGLQNVCYDQEKTTESEKCILAKASFKKALENLSKK